MATLTAANSTLLISVRGLFPVPQQIYGYSADAAFATDAVEKVQTVMGVDGRFSGGYTPAETRMTITLQPDQGGDVIFDAWAAAQDAVQDVYVADGVLTIPSIGKTWIMIRGFLMNYQPMVSAQKILQPRPFVIAWESTTASPI